MDYHGIIDRLRNHAASTPYDDVKVEMGDAADALGAAKKAADAILAPLTMEVGRLLEEAPNYEVTIVAFDHEIKLTAKHFMDLYRSTDF